MKKLTISTHSLKDFLLIFGLDDVLENLKLGDTAHRLGFVDESFLEGRRKISEILAFDYDFGLVLFQCKIRNFDIQLNALKSVENYQFEVIGKAWELKLLAEKIDNLNILQADKYIYFFEKIYK